MSAHLSSPVWDLIVASEPITALSLPHTPVHRIIFISAQSHRAWPKRTAVLSLSFSFFPPLFSCHLSCAISVITQFYPISFFCILAFLLLWTLLILESSNTFPQLHQFHSHFPCFLKCHILPFPSLLTLLSLSLLFSVWQWHWKVHPCNFKDGTAWELSVNAAWGTGLVHALQHKGTLVHDEHCKWCKAGLVFMKSKPFKVVVFFFKISPVLVLIQ